MTSRTAHTRWSGSASDGGGTVELSTSDLAAFQVSYPDRVSELAPTTSPEELLAAAQSSCYAMQLADFVAAAGGTINSLDVQVDVELVTPLGGGNRLADVHLSVTVDVAGLDRAHVLDLVVQAHRTCPVGAALAGVRGTLDAVVTVGGES